MSNKLAALARATTGRPKTGRPANVRAKTALAQPQPQPPSPSPSPIPLSQQVDDVLAALAAKSTAHDMANFARFGIAAHRPFGVSMANMQAIAKRIGQNHKLAAALWETNRYEARMVASLIDEPAQVTPAQMERWCRDFDNWGICDTVCFFLFDRTPHAYAKVEQWAPRDAEFVRRGAFALLACLALHDKQTDDEAFVRLLPLIERGAADERPLVKKAVSWALRAIGTRGPALQQAARDVATRLADSSSVAARWVGRDALKALTRAPKPRKR